MSSIKRTDLVKDDAAQGLKDINEALKDEIALLEATQIELMKFSKAMAEATKAGAKNLDEYTNLKKVYEESNKITKEQIDNQRELEKLKREQLKTTVAEEKAEQQLQKIRTRQEQQLKRQNNEYFKLAKQTRDLKNEAKDLAAQMLLLERSGKANTAEYEKLGAQYSKVSTQANKFDADLKNIDKSLGDNFRNVGNYESALDGLGGATGGVIQGFKGMSAAAKAFLANPIVLVLAAIVGSLVALVKLFSQTKRGSDLMARGMAVLEGVMNALVGVVDRLAENLIRLFEDPVGALKDLGEALVQNIINRFLSIIEFAKAVGKALSGLANLDLDKLKEAANDAGQAFIQLQTGMDAEQQRAFAESVRETTKSILEEAAAFDKLRQEQLKVRRENRELSKQVAELTTQEELLQSAADDATKSFAEREELARQASELTIKRASLEQKIAAKNLDIIRQEINLKRAQGREIEDLLDQEVDAFTTLEDAQRNYLLTVRDNQKRQSELVQDRLERDLDILIDGFDNQKTINERIIADSERTFEERNAKLNETRILFEDSFAKQIETIQEFTKIQLDANDLINESDAVALNQKIRSLGLSEIIEGRLLEVIRDRRTAIQDLYEAERDLINESIENQRKAAKIRQQLRQEELQGEIDALEAVEGAEDEAFELKKQKLIEQAEFEMDNEELTADEILLINQRLENELADLEREALNNKKKLKEEEDKVDKEYFDKLKERRKEQVEVAKSAIDSINSLTDSRIDKLNEEDAAAKRNYDNLVARTSGATDIASESLAKLREIEQQNEQRRQQLEKRKVALQAASTVLDTFDGFLQQDPQNPTSALAKTATNVPTLVGVVSTLINSLPSFDVGAEYLDGKGQNVDGKGGFLAINHPKERIVPADINEQLRGIPNTELPNLGAIYKGMLSPVKYDAASQLMQGQYVTPTQLEQALGGVKDAIKENSITMKSNYNNLTNTVTTIIQDKFKTEVTKKNIA